MSTDNTFTIEVDGATITIRPRRVYSNNWRDYSKAPRMFVYVKDETVMDNLVNRKRRPYNVYKSMLRASGVSKVLQLGNLQWSQKAGCTCPCSPGFILPAQAITNEDTTYCYFDVWVALHGAPSVDERKAPRVLAGV